MDRTPAIAVIVPAHRSAAVIGDCLDALLAQTEPDVEVWVVDTPGPESSREAVEERREAFGGRLGYLETGPSPAVKRNTGAARSRAPFLAFTDPDCEPEPAWLATGLAALRAGADVVQGPTRPLPGAPVSPFGHTVHVEGPTGLFEACNVLYSRPAFEAAGGFPEELYEELGEHFGEDTALGWAVRAAGGRHVFVPDAVVRHKVFPREVRRHLAACWRARHFPRLLRLRPEARKALRLGVFLSRDTALLELALAGAGLAARRRSALLLAVPYLVVLAHRTFDRPAPRPLARAAGLALSDLALAGALWTGSLRHRSPVL